MARFRYQALNADQQPVADELEAESVLQAIAELESRGLTVLSIGYASSHSPARSSPVEHASASSLPSVAIPADDAVEQAVLRQHMSRVIERAHGILPALRAYAEEMPRGRRRRELTQVLEVLKRGDALEATQALRRLPAYWIPLLSSATISPDPGRVLREFLSESQRAEEFRRQWWLALSYPLLLASLALAVMVALSALVVPVFHEMFVSFDLPLPSITLLVIHIAFMISSGRIVWVAGGIVIAAWLLRRSVRLLPRSTREWFDDRFGTPLGRRTAIARFSQFTADLLEAELSVPGALRIAGFAIDSSRVQRSAWRLAHRLESSGTFEPQAFQRFLTASVLHCLTAEMPPGARIRMLREVSSCQAQRARARLSWTRGMIEPIAICVIGFLVGGTVLALFMPLVVLVHGLAG